MSTRKHIVDSIVALAKRMRRTPSLLEFVARTRVTKHSVMRHFPRWNEAIKAAGPEPRPGAGRPADNDPLTDGAGGGGKKEWVPSRGAASGEGEICPRTDRRGIWCVRDGAG